MYYIYIRCVCPYMHDIHLNYVYSLVLIPCAPWSQPREILQATEAVFPSDWLLGTRIIGGIMGFL